ncbi:hypothetical protein [Streptomyces scopuliridis]|uniref:hypothetical protein n=1 Tax=Streptomyces scopuliridis TaxID=452529 RepID=UPI0034343861
MQTTPTFQIVTDNRTYTQGDTHHAFTPLGRDAAYLESYEHEGDFLVLHYDDGLRLDIPEHRIQYIASTPSTTPDSDAGVTVGQPIRHSN